MSNMEINEAELELLTQKLSNLCEVKLRELNSTQISTLSEKIPVIKTMLEFRTFRDDFLLQFNEPAKINQPISYTEELLKQSHANPDLSPETQKSLRNFFSDEIERVKTIRSTIEKRFNNAEVVADSYQSLIQFMKSLTDRIYQCENGIERLQATTISTFSLNDIIMQISSTFSHELRNSFFRSVKELIKSMPLSSRGPIINKILTSVKDVICKDSKNSFVCFYCKVDEDIDPHLTRLAKKFGIETDISVSDGQQFLYYADKAYSDLWNYFENEDQVKTIYIQSRKVLHPLDYSIHQKLVDNVTIDIKVNQIMNQLFSSTKEDVLSNIKEFVRFYKSKIQDHKLVAYLELRFIHMKFLGRAILGLLNYFTMIKSNEKYKVRRSQISEAIIEILDEKNEPFIFQSAQKEFEEYKKLIAKVCSYYLNRFEQSSEEADVNVDREAMLERLFIQVYNFLNAKRSLIQPLLEAYEHSRNEKFTDIIATIIDEKPKVVLHVYRGFDTSLAINVKLMEKKGQMIRFLLNSQILHERQVTTQLAQNVPLFDRPITLPGEGCQYTPYPESVTISLFEVYQSLGDLGEFLSLVQNASLEFIETLNIKGIKFYDFVELAIWNQIEELIKNDQGYLPFDKCTIKFNFLLSDSVNSLFNSPFVNRITEFDQISENMNEGRKLRFYLALKRFLHLTHQLEDEIIRTNMLQTAYFETCDWLNIAERAVLMSVFRQTSKQEAMELHTQSSSSDKVLDFALSEFMPFNINFCSTSDVKDVLFSCDFSLLVRLVQFQRLQNIILETAVRYNNVLLDSDRLVQFFEFTEGHSDVFLTTNDTPQPDEETEKFMKQFIAPILLGNSTTIYRDNQLAQQDKLSFMISIASIKNRTRTILQAQTRQKDYSIGELFDLYRDEMLESFSCIAYRYEIVRVTLLERELLQQNSFLDCFILGPKQDTVFLNEAGRIESFFYVPTWVECFQMMQSSPASRQTMALKPLLEYVTWRYMILCLVRFECSIDMSQLTIFTALHDDKFMMETAVFQKLANEFGRLPNAREVDVASDYLKDKYTHFFYRLEYSLLSAIETFYASVKLDTAREEQNTDGNQNPTQLVASINNPRFGDIMKDTWHQFHTPFVTNDHLLTQERYTPIWTQRFLEDSKDGDRLELKAGLEGTDKFLEESVNELKGTNVMEIFQILPAATNFLRDAISQIHLKFAYFLLLSHTNETEINYDTSVMLINHEVVIHGATAWNDVIISEVNRSFVRLDEPSSKFTPVPTSKQTQAIFDVVRNQIDTIILTNQIKYVNDQIVFVNSGFFESGPKNVTSLKPNISSEMFSNKPEEKNNVVTPQQAEKQFDEELEYSIAQLTNFAFESLDATTLERRNHNGTFSTIYDADVFEATCEKLSFAMTVFGNGSVDDMSSTWSDYIGYLVAAIKKNKEEDEMLDLVEKMGKDRFDDSVNTDAATLFEKQFHEINTLRKRLSDITESQTKKELAMKEDLRVEFTDLVHDLNKEIVRRKGEFGKIKRSVLNQVSKKIRQAQEVQLKIDPNVHMDGSVTKKKIQGFDEENEELKKKIQTLRIIRCMANIAVKRIFAKKINLAEADRKQANAILWSSKLMYEENGQQMENQLRDTHRRLADLEITIEKLKQQLENEKMTNIQLVHWKAKNEHKVEDLKKEISQFEDTGDVNIDDLLSQIQSKQKILDKLREENQKLEDEADEKIRKPLQEVGKLKDTIRDIRISKQDLVARTQSVLLSSKQSEQDQKRDVAAQLLSQENIKLKHDNELLRAQIEKLTGEKLKKSVDQKRLMESTIKGRSQLARANTRLGTITKPFLPPRSSSKISNY